MPDLDFRPDHPVVADTMASWWLRGILILFTLFSTTNGSQFPLQPPVGYGAPYVTSEKSFPTLHSETAYDLQQEPYTWEPPTEAEVPELSALSDEYFTRVGLPVFPDHSIRIKKSADWCDSSVKYVLLIVADSQHANASSTPVHTRDISTLALNISSSTSLNRVLRQTISFFGRMAVPVAPLR